MDQEYDTLLSAYKRMFGMVDAIHFNSQNTYDVYEKYIQLPSGSLVAPITHSGVGNHRQLRNYDSPVLRLGFIGSEASYKGLPMLKRVLGMLNVQGFCERISLSVYGGKTGIDSELGNVEYKGRFNSNQMESVYNSMDLLVVPSICYETFGFTIIEAFQFGVPALVSSTVGAKDVVKMYAPQFVFEGECDLCTTLQRLICNRQELVDYNKAIVNFPWNITMETHANEIVRLFY